VSKIISKRRAGWFLLIIETYMPKALLGSNGGSKIELFNINNVPLLSKNEFLSKTIFRQPD